MTSRKPAVLAGILLFQEEAGPLDPPFWRHICGTLFGLRSTIIYLAILFEKVRNRQCLCGFSACLRSEEHTSELQSRLHLVCRLLLEKKKKHATRELAVHVLVSLASAILSVH